jgi:uroporphyrinogen decarboxylase
MTLKNDTFLRALKREATEYTPVWLMRQAGRYLPEYNATRKKAGDFLTLCKTPELACEVTLQPLERFPLDAAILFSDILTIPDAMGLGLYFAEGEGPKFQRPIKDEADVAKLHIPDPNVELRYVMEAVKTIRGALNERVPLIGFSGSPWTLACYMIEGGGSDDFRKIKSFMYQRPDLLHKILEILAITVADYLNAQIEAGVQTVMIFDSWGGVLADGNFQRFSLNYTQKVIDRLKRTRVEIVGNTGVDTDVPSIVFTKGGGQWLGEIAATGCTAVGLDWTTNLGKARALVGQKVALQGNLDPMVLFADPQQVATETCRVLDSFGKPSDGVGHVFNLGHGISQFTPPDRVAAMVEAVHSHSRKLRK